MLGVCLTVLAIAATTAAQVPAATVQIRVDVRQEGRPVSRYLTGACIEDVNHEIYGGIYSQMIFGESFQEPPAGVSAVKGFAAFGGEWKIGDPGILDGPAGEGPKLVSSIVAPFADGGAGVEIYLPKAEGDGIHNAGLIVRVAKPGEGVDRFDGYEVAIDAGRKLIGLGRHQQNFRLLAEAPYDVPVEKWIALSVRLQGKRIDISVDGKSVLRFDDPNPLGPGGVGLRQWQRPARYRNVWAKARDGQRVELPFDRPAEAPLAISGMWAPVVMGEAVLQASIERERPFIGLQSQRVTLMNGKGEAGIENRGLNRQGMAFAANKPYEGYIWLRSTQPLDVYVSAEGGEGGRMLAREKIPVAGGDEWKRYDFTLTPAGDEPRGRFSVRLASPGSVVIGHAFLQTGEWGRFKKLPLRRDVVEGLIDQGVTVLRYGGSMVNNAGYRWKKMIGSRDRRPPYRGHWYPYSTNGWGIIDFLDLCEAAGFLPIPAFCADESAQDMADFMEYVNGSAESEWGKKRAADGHPAPYNLKHFEFGNEEAINEAYWQKFEKIAAAVWEKDPNVVIVVGDFQYNNPITDPMRITGADSRITSLAVQKKILDLAKKNGREVWFDVHLWTDGPGRSRPMNAFKSYVDAIERLADGAKHHVVVFEFNANNHEQRRALANADAIGQIIRDGRVPVALSANCLQVDGQNDNGWDQGLLFLNPSKTWLQPPGYVTRMVSRAYRPRAIDAKVEGEGAATLSVTATKSEDGKRVVLHVVNPSDVACATQIQLDGFTPAADSAKVQELAAPIDARNTAAEPARVAPKASQWRHGLKEGRASYSFPAHSFTVMELE